MGINNLLKFMKPHVQSVHIKKYSGKRVGIDAYSWLHKGAYSCSMELCLNIEGDKKFQYLKYFMHRIDMLLHYKITPVVVFDGGSIPCKAATEDERHRKKKASRDMAMKKLKEGSVSAASELFQRAVDITPHMAHQLVRILRSENVEYIVAPYEADAQLAYLSTLEVEGGVAAVISEDSDLLAYGCPAVVFKMDRYGNGKEILLDKVFNAVGCVPSFKNFDRELLTGMCVLAGCDFLPCIPGVGISKAYNLVAKYRNFSRVLSTLRLDKAKQMPEDYAEAFREAVAVFQHARVFDTVSKRLKTLKPLTPELMQREDKELDFLGPDLPPALAIAIAEGNMDPCTMEAFDQLPPQQDWDHLTLSVSANRSLSQTESIQSIKDSSELKGEMLTKAKTNVLEEWKSNIIVDEVLQSREVLALRKLVSPLRREACIDTLKATIASKIPSNNPFKKQKLNGVQLSHEAEVDKQVSEVTENEIESEDGVDPKPLESTHQKGRTKNRKVFKQNHSNSSASTKSILNFFSRV